MIILHKNSIDKTFKDSIEYRKKMRILKVKTPDKGKKMLSVSEAMTVAQLMDVICKKIGMVNNNEYSLASSSNR